jgi:hypothetical protein
MLFSDTAVQQRVTTQQYSKAVKYRVPADVAANSGTATGAEVQHASYSIRGLGLLSATGQQPILQQRLK